MCVGVLSEVLEVKSVFQAPGGHELQHEMLNVLKEIQNFLGKQLLCRLLNYKNDAKLIWLQERIKQIRLRRKVPDGEIVQLKNELLHILNSLSQRKANPWKMVKMLAAYFVALLSSDALGGVGGLFGGLNIRILLTTASIVYMTECLVKFSKDDNPWNIMKMLSAYFVGLLLSPTLVIRSTDALGGVRGLFGELNTRILLTTASVVCMPDCLEEFLKDETFIRKFLEMKVGKEVENGMPMSLEIEDPQVMGKEIEKLKFKLFDSYLTQREANYQNKYKTLCGISLVSLFLMIGIQSGLVSGSRPWIFVHVGSLVCWFYSMKDMALWLITVLLSAGKNHIERSKGLLSVNQTSK